jgi:hypothetical protein
VRHAVVNHGAHARVAMQDLGTAARRRIARKRRGDIPLNQCANSGQLGCERVRDTIDLIRGEPLTWSLGGEQYGAASNLFAQAGKGRGEMCGNRRLTIGGNAELARKECGTKFGQHASNLTTRWAVARRHRTASKGSIGSGQFTTKCSSINAHSVMPFASKSPS